MSALLQKLRALLAAPSTRAFLGWCLPGVLVALALRIALTVQLPWAIYHDDTPDFLFTAETLLSEHQLELHSKKTFLVPLAFTLPFFLPAPVMLTIPLALHALGIGVVLLVGLLCRLWCARWRLFIVPLTVLAGANPFLLWYEHTLMAETIFLGTLLLVPVAGTLFALVQTRARFLLLCAALLLAAGGRPEGKLFFGFGLLLVAVLHWGAWRESRARLVGIALLAVATHVATRTSQAGLLLYTSLARFTPTELCCAPGFEPYIAPIRADLQQRWEEKPSSPRVKDRRAVGAAIKTYLDDRKAREAPGWHEDSNRFALKLAVETFWRNLPAMPLYAGHRFRLAATDAPSGRFDREVLWDEQIEALGDGRMALRLSAALFGRAMGDMEELREFFASHYRELPWLDRWQNAWLAAVNRWRFRDVVYREHTTPPSVFIYRGVPIYFVAAAVGLILVALRRQPLQRFHLVWGAALLGFFFVIMLTANVRPRFRIAFEPFWFLYLALLAEQIGALAAAGWRALRPPRP